METSRRAPQQARSRERVDRILAAAAELIGEGGVEQVRMVELAARAGVPASSIYQYFPDKVAIVRALAEQLIASVQADVENAFADVEDAEGFLRGADALIVGFYARTLAEPAARDIQLALQSDAALQQLDLEDTQNLAGLAYDAGRPFVPPSRRRQFRSACLLAVHGTAAAVRLAVVLDRREGDALVAQHRAMVRDHLRALLALDPA